MEPAVPEKKDERERKRFRRRWHKNTAPRLRDMPVRLWDRLLGGDEKEGEVDAGRQKRNRKDGCRGWQRAEREGREKKRRVIGESYDPRR